MRLLFFLIIWLVGCATPRIIEKPVLVATNQRVFSDHIDCGTRSGYPVPQKNFDRARPSQTIKGLIYTNCMAERGWK